MPKSLMSIRVSHHAVLRAEADIHPGWPGSARAPDCQPLGSPRDLLKLGSNAPDTHGEPGVSWAGVVSVGHDGRLDGMPGVHVATGPDTHGFENAGSSKVVRSWWNGPWAVWPGQFGASRSRASGSQALADEFMPLISVRVPAGE